jgi:hypothetical protein
MAADWRPSRARPEPYVASDLRNTWSLLPAEAETTLGEAFIEQTKLNDLNLPGYQARLAALGGTPYAAALDVSGFVDVALARGEVSSLLSQLETCLRSMRLAPRAPLEGRCVIDLWISSHDLEDRPATYYYHPYRHSLYRVVPRELDAVKGSRLAFVVAATLTRTRWALGDRAHRDALREGGRVIEQLLTSTRAADLGMCIEPAFDEDLAERELFLDGVNQIVIAALLVR